MPRPVVLSLDRRLRSASAVSRDGPIQTGLTDPRQRQPRSGRWPLGPACGPCRSRGGPAVGCATQLGAVRRPWRIGHPRAGIARGALRRRARAASEGAQGALIRAVEPSRARCREPKSLTRSRPPATLLPSGACRRRNPCSDRHWQQATETAAGTGLNRVPYRFATVQSGSKPRHLNGSMWHTTLYMAALTATRRHPPLAAFYKRLRDRGKQPKLASSPSCANSSPSSTPSSVRTASGRPPRPLHRCPHEPPALPSFLGNHP